MDPQQSLDVCQQSQQIPLLVFAWTLLSAAILVTALRLYSKIKQSHGITADDCIALASTIFAAAAVSFLTVWIHTGLGRHVQCLQNPRSTLLWSLLTQISSIIGICLLKISVCFCIRRIVEHESRFLSTSIYVLILFIFGTHITQVVFFLLQCRPLDTIWSNRTESSRCFTRQELSLIYYIGYSLDALTDFICASIPVAIIILVPSSNRTRIGFGVLIGFGTLITGCAIVKTVTLMDVWTPDFTWHSAVPVWFTIAEYYGGIVIASIPSLAGLFVRSPSNDKSLYDAVRNGSLQSMNRKGSAWAMATPRKALPGAAKKHFSISTFGLSEGEVGSRVTIVDNRLTVVDNDVDHMTCVAEEGDDEFERATLDNRSVRTATRKSSHMGWNKEDVFGLGILGKDDTFGREGSSRHLRDRNQGSSISSSIGHLTRPSTPKRASVSLRPLTPKSAPTTPSSALGGPKSLGFLPPQDLPKLPESSHTRHSRASSLYSGSPPSAGLLPTIPSPPAATEELPLILDAPSRPTTPKPPKTPTWTTSPSGFKSIKASKPPHLLLPPNPPPTDIALRTLQNSRPGTPKRSLSVTVPVSKFQAEMSGALSVGARRAADKASDPGGGSGSRRSKVLPGPPVELSVVDTTAAAGGKVDTLDGSC